MTKCCDITAGQLNVQITLEKPAYSADGAGGLEEAATPAETFTVWAKSRALTGAEAWEAQRIQPGNYLKVTIRFKGDSYGAPYFTAADWRIKIRGREYAILSSTDVEMRQEWIEFLIMESRPT